MGDKTFDGFRLPPSFTKERTAAIAASFLGLLGGQPSVFIATATIFFVPLSRGFGWGRTIPSLMHVASVGGVLVASIWTGRIVARFGAPRTVICSGLLLAIVFSLLALQSGSPAMAVALCLMGGMVGAGTGLGVYLTILPKWFDANLGRALGVSILGISVGGIVMPIVVLRLVDAIGWRAAYFSLAAIHLALTLVVAAILKWLAGRESGLSRTGQIQQFTGNTLSEAMHMRSFWILSATIFFAALGVFGIMVHLVPFYQDRNIAQAQLPLVMTGVGLGTLLGRVGSGLLLDRIEVRYVAIATFSLGGCGIIWLGLIEGGISLTSALIPPFLIGLALGSETDVLPYLVRRLYGLLHYPVIYNRLLVGHYLGAIAGTLLLGWAKDNLASPQTVMLALGLGCFLAALIALGLPKPRAH